MYQSTVVTTAPDGLPLSLGIATQQLRKDMGDCDQELVELTMAAVVNALQRQYALRFITQTIVEYYDAPPCNGQALLLHNRPITAVTKVEYKDPDTGAWTTWDEVTTGGGGHALEKCATSPELNGYTSLHLLLGEDWPDVAALPGSFRITCTAGYGATGQDVPADDRIAMLLMLADYYENPENPVQTSPNMTAAANLMRHYRKLA